MNVQDQARHSTVATARQDGLPRLLYIGGVPVESTYHGSALLFRLLSDYPADELLVLEGSNLVSQETRRLPDVRYFRIPAGIPRLLNTRFHLPYATFLARRAQGWSRRVSRLSRSFQPEAVLTVAHGPLWITAAAYASRRNLPLHLVCHDLIESTTVVSPMHRPWLLDTFAACYRQAASRLCVSPYMRDEYQRRFGEGGLVLYPSRSPKSLAHPDPPARLKTTPQPFTVAFGGTVNSAGHWQALKEMAVALGELGGRLLLFGPISPSEAVANGIPGNNVEFRGR